MSLILLDLFRKLDITLTNQVCRRKLIPLTGTYPVPVDVSKKNAKITDIEITGEILDVKSTI